MGLKLNATTGGGSVELDVPNEVTSNVTFTLPDSHGSSGQVMHTDGSGAFTFTHLVPPGAVIYVLQNTAPEGYLKANGATISRTTFANLFSAIGTHYGSGDGSTTFTIPDLRGEFLRAWDDSKGVDSGRAYGTAQADAYKSHGHNLRGGSGDPPDWFGGSGQAYGLQQTGGTLYGNYVQLSGGTETRPRNIALLACIKF